MKLVVTLLLAVLYAFELPFQPTSLSDDHSDTKALSTLNIGPIHHGSAMVLLGPLEASVYSPDNPLCLLRAIEIDHRSFVKAALRCLNIEGIVCPVLALGDSLTLLQFAAYYRSHHTAKKLARRFVDLNEQSMFQGYTALHIAVMSQSTEILKLLLGLGADANIRDKRGRTPIMSACEIGCLQAFEILLPHWLQALSLERNQDSASHRQTKVPMDPLQLLKFHE